MMIYRSNRLSRVAMLSGLTMALGGFLPLTVMAQHSVFHRHPNLTGAAAGYTAYRAAKHTGKNRVARGRHRNLMQRHPIATGVVAGMAAKHLAKKH